jgi:acyl carrier protein
VTSVDATIRGVIEEHGRLAVTVSSLDDNDDLYQNGLSSHASVNVMLGLEDAFDIEFPDELLRKGTFKSVSAIRRALESIGVEVAPD